MKYTEKIKAEYKRHQLIRKVHIRFEPKRSRRFWMRVEDVIFFPFRWLWYNIRDWRSAVCIIISLLLWSSSVWAFYLASLLNGWTTTPKGRWLFGIGSTVWVWWASPVGSPFILFVTFTGIGMKMVFDKIIDIRQKRRKSNENKNNNKD